MPLIAIRSLKIVIFHDRCEDDDAVESDFLGGEINWSTVSIELWIKFLEIHPEKLTELKFSYEQRAIIAQSTVSTG